MLRFGYVPITEWGLVPPTTMSAVELIVICITRKRIVGDPSFASLHVILPVERKKKKKSKLHPLVHWAGRVQKRDTPSFLLNNPCKRAWFWCSLESVMKKGLVYCQTTQQGPFTTMRSLNSTSNSNGGVSKPLASVTWASVNTDSLGADGAFVIGAHAGERLTWPIGHCCPGLSRSATLMGQLTN